MERLISIETKKFKTFFKLLAEEYREDVDVEIDGRKYTEKDYDWLISNWCTKKALKRTINFTMKKDGKKIFGFHDSPDEMWAAFSELDFIKRLRRDGILKYWIDEWENPSSWWERVVFFFRQSKQKVYKG